MKLAVFDCDGTLVDSQANICRSMAAAFAEAGLAVPPDPAIRRIVGLSLVEAMHALLPDGDHDLHHRLATGYKTAFQRMRADNMLDDEPLFDGIADVLGHLRDTGWTLGVATGKSDRGLAHILDRHALSAHFATLQTADRHPSKPDPAMLLAAMAEAGATPAETVMIGDTSFDIAMGRAARVRTVGVAWGYHTPDDLADAGADVIVTRVADLPAALVR